MAEVLIALVRLPGFNVENRGAVLRALELYGSTNVDFGQALIGAAMEHAGSKTLYSYDTHFDKFPSIERCTPGRRL